MLPIRFCSLICPGLILMLQIFCSQVGIYWCSEVLHLKGCHTPYWVYPTNSQKYTLVVKDAVDTAVVHTKHKSALLLGELLIVECYPDFSFRDGFTEAYLTRMTSPWCCLGLNGSGVHMIRISNSIMNRSLLPRLNHISFLWWFSLSFCFILEEYCYMVFPP